MLQPLPRHQQNLDLSQKLISEQNLRVFSSFPWNPMCQYYLLYFILQQGDNQHGSRFMAWSMIASWPGPDRESEMSLLHCFSWITAFDGRVKATGGEKKPWDVELWLRRAITDHHILLYSCIFHYYVPLPWVRTLWCWWRRWKTLVFCLFTVSFT